MNMFHPNCRTPNSLEKLYFNHIIGKRDLKSKLGLIHVGADTKKSFILNSLILDLLDVAKLGENSIGHTEEEVPVVISHTYFIPFDIDAFVSDLFDFSLTHNIVEVNPKAARIYLAKSKNGKTNITKDIMELLVSKLTPFWQTTKMKTRVIDQSPSDMI